MTTNIYANKLKKMSLNMQNKLKKFLLRPIYKVIYKAISNNSSKVIIAEKLFIWKLHFCTTILWLRLLVDLNCLKNLSISQ